VNDILAEPCELIDTDLDLVAGGQQPPLLFTLNADFALGNPIIFGAGIVIGVLGALGEAKESPTERLLESGQTLTQA